jgi:hypothetical protein
VGELLHAIQPPVGPMIPVRCSPHSTGARYGKAQVGSSSSELVLCSCVPCMAVLWVAHCQLLVFVVWLRVTIGACICCGPGCEPPLRGGPIHTSTAAQLNRSHVVELLLLRWPS